MNLSDLIDSPMKTSAILSPCRKYRYQLERVWDDKKERCVFIGLNPSTADEKEDDPTIRRCIGFAKDWGFGALVMLNIFGFRSTSPLVLYKHAKPTSHDDTGDGDDLNAWHVFDECRRAGRVVCAWGSHGAIQNQGEHIKKLINGEGIALRHFGLTKNGQPKHPLYLKKTAELFYFEPINREL